MNAMYTSTCVYPVSAVFMETIESMGSPGTGCCEPLHGRLQHSGGPSQDWLLFM